MGVKGLWQLLLPTGRRISVETLSGKRLAIDASIWLTQFLKANRDPETGAVRANAHLIGFLRRICKLLFHGIKPVFVFDGATPEIKLREIRARKERRDRINCFKSDDDNEGVKRLARRILVARLKKQKESEKNQAPDVEYGVESKNARVDTLSNGTKTEGAFASGFRLCSPRKDDENEQELMMGKEERETISDSEGVAIIDDEERKDFTISDNDDYLQTLTYEEEQVNNDWDDALVAAESDSSDSLKSNGDSDEESTLNLHMLTSLPAKSRVDAIEKARRQQRMRSRKEFMSVAADPHSYSQCQLKNFLKSANLNRQVNKLGKMDAICSRGGLEGEQIASDSTRRFIFTKGEVMTDKHPTTGLLSDRGLMLTRKRKEHVLHEEEKELENGRRIMTDANVDEYDGQGGFMIDESVDHYDDQGGFMIDKSVGQDDDQRVTGSTFTGQDYDEQEGFIVHVNDGDSKEKTFAQHEIEVSSTDSSSDASITYKCLQSSEPPSADEVKLHASQTFREEASNHELNSVLIVANKEPSIMTAESVISINEDTDDQHTGEGFFHASISSHDHSNKHRNLGVDVIHDQPDFVSKVADKEPPSVMKTYCAMVYDQSIDDERKSESIVDGSASPDQYSFCVGHKEESQSNVLKDEDTDDDDIDWEDGEGTSKDNINGSFENCHNVIEETHDLKTSQGIHEYCETAISKKRVDLPNYYNLEDDDEFQTLNTEIDQHGNASFTAHVFEEKSKSDDNAAALLNAHATASQLTDWAGRVVRQAIRMHLGERAEGTFHTHSETDSCSPSEDEILHNNHSIEYFSRDNSTQSQTDYLNEFRDTSLESLQKQHDILRDEDNRRERDIDTVTDDMIEDVIFLLTLFGIPYVKAPAEAEAQAVELEKLGLVDGVVTEDSDAIIFGSKSVYRNIFDDKKYVELYLSSDSEAVGIGYNEKIALAMLLGGDYTQGVRGVGIVNGMEILKAFPVSEGIIDGLNAFKNWLDGFEIDEKTNNYNPSIAEFTKKHKSARSRWLLPSNFPSTFVLQAYTRPVVDSSKTRFSWGVPDVDAIRMFLTKKVGWEVPEIDRIILPVTKAMADAKTQKRIDGYFMRSEDNIKFADVRSKRLRKVWDLDKRTETNEEE
mmetsp:Transcript_7049/g.13296  ORF Transcript_7049/g.13296 Transcript_7049/m.13296 type:complete len:1123 (-) Transcript_7049:134-3502(-)